MSPEPAGSTHRTFAPVVRTQAELEAAWKELIHPLGFHRTSVWLMLIQADGVPLPQLVEIADCPESPTRAEVDQLAAFLADLPTEEPDRPGEARGSWAVLRSRPGPAALIDADRLWASMLHAACTDVGVRLAPMHVASDSEIRPLPLDELRRAS